MRSGQVIPKKVQKVLSAHNLQAIEFEEGSTSTAEAAARKLGVTVAQIAKSLLFLGKNKRFYLVICSGTRRVISSKLKNIIGVKSRMANADETLKATGFLPGGVCPFGIEGIDILIDGDLKRYGTIYPAGGTNSSGVPMTFEQLQDITGGRVSDLTQPMERNE
jgi:prolyl-tRNA editing enzyme YbaK/EbsC (Cys-tRNA(Pro) deacylase)